jgi:transcriptional regulator with XRE-family HTH domain
MMTVEELKKVFGQNVKNYRELRGWSQPYLAEKIDSSVNTVSEIETGKKFARAEKIVKFAELFNIDAYVLFKADDFQPDNTANILSRYSREIHCKIDKTLLSYLEKIKSE